MEMKIGKRSEQRSSESSSNQGPSSAIAVSQFVYSNPLMAGKNDKNLEKQMMRMKSKKDPKNEVNFYQVDRSAGRAVNREVALDVDNKFFAHLVTPPVEYDSTFQSENPFPTVSLEAPRVLTQEERSDWQQGLFECWKTDAEFIILASICPDIAAFKNYKESKRIWTPRIKRNPSFRALLKIFLKMLGLACCSLYFMKFCTSVAIPTDLIVIPSFMLLLWALCMLMIEIRFPDRYHLIENSSIKYTGYIQLCCDSLWIPICCQPCNQCQMHAEIKYQQRIRRL